MSIQRISFTSDKLNTKVNQLNTPKTTENTTTETTTTTERKQETTTEKSNTVTAPTKDNTDNNSTITSEKSSHKARNWTIGLSAVAVLTTLSVVAGRKGYLGKNIQGMLRSAKKEAGELGDDISGAIEAGSRKGGDASNFGEETILGKLDEEPVIISKPQPAEEEGVNIFSDTLDEAVGVSTTRAAEKEVSVLDNLSPIDEVIEEKVTLMSKDGKFKIPMTKEEIDVEATRAYLKAPKLKIPKKYRKIQPFNYKDFCGDIPEHIDLSKVVAGLYIHNLPKGEKLFVHINDSGIITKIERGNSKGIGDCYIRFNPNGKIEYAEYPKGTEYFFDDNGRMTGAVKQVKERTYYYESDGKLNSFREDISDSVYRSVYPNGNDIDSVNYFVYLQDNKPVLVKSDSYNYDTREIMEDFWAGGNPQFSKSSPMHKGANKLKFWQYFPKIGLTFEKDGAAYITMSRPKQNSKMGDSIYNQLTKLFSKL